MPQDWLHLFSLIINDNINFHLRYAQWMEFVALDFVKILSKFFEILKELTILNQLNAQFVQIVEFD